MLVLGGKPIFVNLVSLNHRETCINSEAHFPKSGFFISRDTVASSALQTIYTF